MKVVMSKRIAIGIDLGEANSAVAYVDHKGEAKIISNDCNDRKTPSVVFFENNERVVVGQTAKDEAELSPERVVAFVKREMGKRKEYVRAEDNNGVPKPYEFFGKIYSPEEITALILKKLKKYAEAYFKGEEITDAVITVPAYFNEAEKQATIDAGKFAGLSVLQLINEPTAAAISYGMSTADKSQKVFVFDLGGGTFDVTILDVVVDNGKKEINIVTADGDHRLGGKDWDDKIIEYVSNRFINMFGEDPRENKDSMADLRVRAEKAKKQLSMKSNVAFPIRTIENSFKTELSREKFEEITSELMNRIEGHCNLVLTEEKLTWKDIDTVLLAGGATHMPMIQDLLKRLSGKDIKSDLIDPDECIALGAAIHANVLVNSPSRSENHWERKFLEVISEYNSSFPELFRFNFYDVLGIKSFGDFDEQNYRDRYAYLRTEVMDNSIKSNGMDCLNKAKHILSTPNKKQVYDTLLNRLRNNI